jgi:V4R domain-containing protein
MAETVPEQTMWVVMQTIEKTAGPQTPRLLTRSGLDRFLNTQLSPTSMKPAATQAELIKLYQEVYAMLGEDVTRLFQRNFGEIALEGILHLPEVAQLRAEGHAVPRDQQIAWFVKTWTDWMERRWVRQIVSEDNKAYYLAQEVCYSCYGITGAKRPLCPAGEVIYQRMAREFLGRRIRVTETECAAMGAPRCVYAIAK